MKSKEKPRERVKAKESHKMMIRTRPMKEISSLLPKLHLRPK